MAGVAMDVPLIGDADWKVAYTRFEARQKSQQEWLDDFDRTALQASAAGSSSTKDATAKGGDEVTPAWRRSLGLLCVIGIVHLICWPGRQWSSGKGLSCAASHALSLSCPLGFCFRHVCVFSSSSRG